MLNKLFLLSHKVFFSFQIVRAASPSLDIDKYLFTSVKHEVRRSQWENLLRHYYDNLQKDVKALGGSVSFTFEVSLVVMIYMFAVAM